MVTDGHSQVWSFSPPEEILYERPSAVARGSLEAPDRPLSAISLDYRTAPNSMAPSMRHAESSNKDVEMSDAGPSTAPLQQARETFFSDD